MTKIKKMCKIKEKDFKKLEKSIRELIKKPNFFCKRCLRASVDKNKLCKPEEL
jgi:DNA-directed RNA polymerase specialized sigma54-like protein